MVSRVITYPDREGLSQGQPVAGGTRQPYLSHIQTAAQLAKVRAQDSNPVPYLGPSGH
jgi:hypothetical protein